MAPLTFNVIGTLPSRPQSNVHLTPVNGQKLQLNPWSQTPPSSASPPPAKQTWLQRNRWLVVLFPFLAALCLGGCVTTSSGVTTDKAQCVAWRSIRYHAADTQKTIRQVRVHNRTGQNLKCWK